MIDRFKEKLQLDPAAVPLIGFYHAGGMVANMRPFAKELDAVSGGLAINPLFAELPGRGVRGAIAIVMFSPEEFGIVAPNAPARLKLEPEVFLPPDCTQTR